MNIIESEHKNGRALNSGTKLMKTKTSYLEYSLEELL